MVDLRSLLESLELPQSAPAADKRRRGFAFERFLHSALAAEDLSPRLRIRPTGEEIDGSFELDSRVYLLEAKWHAKPLPASSIYAFKAKVDGKLVGTVGFFASMSGFSEDAVDALTAGKDINVLLLDRPDIEAATEHGMARVLRAKIRAAADEGLVYFPFTSSLAEVRPEATTEVSDVPNDQAELPSTEPEIVIICEGARDAAILTILARRILEANGLAANLRVIPAQGKHGIPRLLNALHGLRVGVTSYIAVAAGDGQPAETVHLIREGLEVPVEVIVVDPEIEVWFAPGEDQPRIAVQARAAEAREPLERYLQGLSNEADLDQLLAEALGFRSFYQAVLGAAKSP